MKFNAKLLFPIRFGIIKLIFNKVLDQLVHFVIQPIVQLMVLYFITINSSSSNAMNYQTKSLMYTFLAFRNMALAANRGIYEISCLLFRFNSLMQRNKRI